MAINDISDFNSNGWASIHEAAYNGSAEDILLILDHAKELHRNIIDIRTIDDMHTTPLLVIFIKFQLKLRIKVFKKIFS